MFPPVPLSLGGCCCSVATVLRRALDGDWRVGLAGENICPDDLERQRWLAGSLKPLPRWNLDVLCAATPLSALAVKMFSASCPSACTHTYAATQTGIITDLPSDRKRSARPGTTGEDTSRTGGSDANISEDKPRQLLRRRGKSGKPLSTDLHQKAEPQDFYDGAPDEEEQDTEEIRTGLNLARDASMSSLELAKKRPNLWTRLFVSVPYDELPDLVRSKRVSVSENQAC